MKPVAFQYHRARDIDDALAQLADSDAKLMAGGCSLGPMLNLRLVRPTLLVDLRHVAELRQVTCSRETLRIGSLRTHAEIEDGGLPDVTNGLLPHVAHRIAYRAVRNRGTMGGSVAHADPAADWISTLIALDASLVIKRPGGERTIAVDRFVLAGFATDLGENEILTAIDIPKLSRHGRWSYHKICRKTGEFAKAIAAIVVDPDRHYARIVCGAVEATPVVMTDTAAALQRAGTAAALEKVGPELRRLMPGHDTVFLQLHAIALRRALCELDRR